MKTLKISVFLLLLASFNLFSQDLSTRIVKGTITDKSTGKPQEVEIVFEDSKGKKFKINSNSITGKYEQLLNVGETYKISFLRYDILKDEVELTPKAPDKSFEPQIQDYEVFIMKKGVELFDYDVFEKGSDKVSPSGEKSLEKLKTIMRFNRALYVDIVIHNDEGGNKGLSEKRLANLKQLTDSWGRFNRKVEYKIDESKGKNPSADTKIIISKVEDSMK